MKFKVTSIILLFCLIAPAVATFSWLQFQRRQVRREVKHKMIAGIDQEDLVLLTFSESETQTLLKWKHAKEFEFEGQMYDIVKTEIKLDSIQYWCWSDHEETALNQQLASVVDLTLGHNRQNRRKKDQLEHFYKNLFLAPKTPAFESILLKIRPPLYVEFNFPSRNISPPEQPPQMV